MADQPGQSTLSPGAFAAGMVLGAVIGFAIWMGTGETVFFPVFLGIGVVLGAVFSAQRSNQNDRGSER